jgi:hypothetical protein
MAAGRIKMWIVGQDVLVTKNEVITFPISCMQEP